MRNLNSIQLSGLRAVEAVARLGTLARAAEELGISVGAVSQRVAKAEAALGRSLFERRPAGMTPTEIGGTMARLLGRGFADLSDAVSEARRDQRSTLVVSVAPIFAARWLVWHLPDFTAQHPQIAIRIDASVDLVDPNRSDVDLCLRVGRGGWAGVRAERLFAQRVTPVCAPALAELLHEPCHLARVPIIRDVHAAYGWDGWLAAEGLSANILGPGPEFSDGSLCLDAAISGAGVFLSWETLDHHALETGQLVAPFARRHDTGDAYWLISAKDRAPSPAQVPFSRWIRQALKASGVAG